MNSYKNLRVWRQSMDLVEKVYAYTSLFPHEEQYGLVSQMRRCAVSIPSNIAEGRRRGSTKEFRRFLLMAFGSGAELETQLEISIRLRYTSATDAQKISDELEIVMRMLNKCISFYSVDVSQPADKPTSPPSP